MQRGIHASFAQALEISEPPSQDLFRFWSVAGVAGGICADAMKLIKAILEAP